MMDRTFRFLRRMALVVGVLALCPLIVGVVALSAATSVYAQAPSSVKPPLPAPAAPSSPPANQLPAPPATPQSGTAIAPGFMVSIAAPSARLHFKIDPKTPLKELLPAAPKIDKIAGPLLGDDLTRVPVMRFQAMTTKDIPSNEAMKQIAHQIAKINHLNGKKKDGFIEALSRERRDLHGLPFAMGDACRTKGELNKQFALAVATVRRALQSQVTRQETVSVPSQLASGQSQASTPTMPVTVTQTVPASADVFWEQYRTFLTKEDKAQGKIRREKCETIALARMAALMQILAPMPDMHPGLVKYLSTVSHIEATRALARMALFSADEEARKAAIEALKVRRERDYTKILVAGLRYPWPAVARRAAEAIAKLEREDLLPQLLALLEEDDPRAPVKREVDGKRISMVHELVRVNHHRSCLLCHAPGNTGKVASETLTAGVPVPGQPLQPPSGGYSNSQPDIIVRLDVTYLRQDFSVLQPVADANPWPEMQRFDFLVRSREVTDEEAKTYREKLTTHEAGEFSPYQRAALVALRQLSGRDTEPTPQAWRRLLNISTHSQRKSETP